MDSEQYSIQLVTEALIAASTQACGCAGDVPGIVRSHLLPLMDILEASGAAYYPTNADPDKGSAISVNASGRREVSAPDKLAAATHNHIRNLPTQAVTNQDSVFSMNHIRNMPVMNAASSLWAAAGEAGTVAIFDLSVRDFTKAEQQIVRMFAFQMASHLTLSAHHHDPTPAAQSRNSGSELAHYMDASKLMAFVSRDLINPLTAMLGYIELLKGEKLGERGTHYLAKLQEQVEKTHKIVMAVGAHPVPAVSPADASAKGNGPKPMHSDRSEYKVPEAVPEPIRPATIPPARVLIIQKNEATLEFKRTVLSALATDVIATFSGAEAILLLQKEELQAVILDDEMDGEWPGRKLYGWICEHRPELRERVLLTVSNHPRPDILELIEDNRVPHVSKPLQMVELFSGMQQILGGRTSKHLN